MKIIIPFLLFLSFLFLPFEFFLCLFHVEKSVAGVTFNWKYHPDGTFRVASGKAVCSTTIDLKSSTSDDE